MKLKLSIALAAALLAAPVAHARPDQQSVFMDDSEIVYGDQVAVDNVLRNLKSLGVDAVRVTVYWRLIAPAADSSIRPGFDASDPDAYPLLNWDRYDRIVKLCQKYGLRPYFTLTAPAPFWATGNPPRADIRRSFNPNAAEFQAFATAVGRRYDGTFQPVTGTVQDPAPPKNPLDILGGAPPTPPPRTVRGPALPRVDFWSIWNEPNHPGWLTPSWIPDPRGGKRPLLMAVGKKYRELVDGGYAGLSATGHAGDTILVGETAPRGLARRQFISPIRPLEFTRDLYCVDSRYRPLTGSDAEVRGCPATPQARSTFAADHPGLFRATGWAHHPYGLEHPPLESDPDKQDVTTADLSRLHTALRQVYGAWGRNGPPPVWLTEYGYQTRPPDPTIGTSWKQQADYLAQAEHLAFSDRRVMSTAQFLLRDDGPRLEYSPSDPRYWGSFQTGLITSSGKQKPSYASYQHPVDVQPRAAAPGEALSIWGVDRPADNAAALKVRVQFAPGATTKFKTLAGPNAVRPGGNYETFLQARRTGSYRLVWSDGSATAPVKVTVAKKKTKKKKKRLTTPPPPPPPAR